MIALDSETTGTDFRHGAKPYFVTTCDDRGTHKYFEWPVDPLTRSPQIPEGDLEELAELLSPNQNWSVVGQNIKFDVTALATIRPEFGEFWAWDRTHDTLLLAHLLCSNRPKDLTSLAIQYLGVNIEPFEDRLREATTAARRMVQQARLRAKRVLVKAGSSLPQGALFDGNVLFETDEPLALYAIAEAGRPDMPSAKEKTWKLDGWLPRLMARELNYPPDHPWWTVLRDYANTDSEVTAALFPVMKEEVDRRGLWALYEERRKCLRIAYGMEARGVTISKTRLVELRQRYTREAVCAGMKCTQIAAARGHALVLPKAGRNKSLDSFLIDGLKLPVVKETDTGGPSFDKTALEEYEATLPEGDALEFIRQLRGKRSRDTALTYLEGYERFWIPLEVGGDEKSIPQASNQDQNLLDLEGQQVQGQRLRTVRFPGGAQGTPSGLSVIRGGDPKRSVGPPPLRPPLMRKSESSVSGDSPGQYEGHDRKGERRQGKGGEASGSKDNGPRRNRDEEGVQGAGRSPGATGGVRATVRDKCPTGVGNSGRDLLEAHPLAQWFVLHPHLNMTGTDTLRWSSAQPNEQNISKKENFNLRYAFGPAPGREWWSLDAKNIERRIPAYEANETEIIALLERPDDPPYYGSEHALVGHLLYPKEFEACLDKNREIDGRVFKKRYAATLYQWTKNFNFALQYGCQEAKGDATAHQVGAYRKVKERFHSQDALNQHWIRFAEKHGYVETIPDRTVDPRHGYPLLCTRTEYGRILPTVPLAYHVSGTAMWWTMKAMIRCQAYLDVLNAVPESPGFHLVLQVHDEMVFDFPKGSGPDPWKTNLPKVRKIQKLMEQGGDDIGIPTPVGVEYHAESWSEGKSF